MVAAARQRGIDVLINAESKRESPAAVTFSNNARLLGVHAAGASSSHAPFFSSVKRLLIVASRPAQLLRDVPRLPFPVSTGDGGAAAAVHVDHIGRRIALSPTYILAMLLAYLKQLAEADLNAAAVAGLRPLRLMHDLAAIALGCGLYRSDLGGTGGPTCVAFVEIGHCDTKVAAVAFDASEMKVLAHGFDADLGGRDFHEVLFEHFAEFRDRYKIDLLGTVKASMRSRAACEKAKKVLCENEETVVNIECLMEKDVRRVIRREEFEKLCAGLQNGLLLSCHEGLLERLVEPCKRAVTDSGIRLERQRRLELVEPGSRIPAIASRTLNASECVAWGCALQCVMLSPTFRVQEYEVQDAVAASIGFCMSEGPASTLSTNALFRRGQPIPSVKIITLQKNSNFDLDAFYIDENESLPGTSPSIISFQIEPFQAHAENSKIEVKVRLNLHGLISVESASGDKSRSEREVNLQQTEEWLYEEGNDETEVAYSSKLEELKKLQCCYCPGQILQKRPYQLVPRRFKSTGQNYPKEPLTTTNKLRLSLDGTPKEVQNNFRRFNKQVKQFHYSKGRRVSAESIYKRNKNVYTTAENGVLEIDVTYGEDTVTFKIEARHHWMREYQVGEDLYELKPDKDQQLFLGHPKKTTLSFGGNHYRISGGDPGGLEIGLYKFRKSLRSIAEKGAKVDPEDIGRFVLLLCEGPKFKQVFNILIQSFVDPSVSRLDKDAPWMNDLLRSWTTKSKEILKHLDYVHCGLPTPLLKNDKIPGMDTIENCAMNVSILHVDACKKDMFAGKEGQKKKSNGIARPYQFVHKRFYNTGHGLTSKGDKSGSEREVNLQQTQEWDYQEGDDETQAVYSSKLEELKKGDRSRSERAMQRQNLPIIEYIYGAMNKQKLLEAKEQEQELAYKDKLIEQTKDRKNVLESYVYDTRNKISERHRSFATDSEREGLVNLQQTEEWHYQEGDDERQAVYSSKLEELKKIGPFQAHAENSKVKVKARLNLHGLISVESASLIDDDHMEVDFSNDVGDRLRSERAIQRQNLPIIEYIYGAMNKQKLLEAKEQEQELSYKDKLIEQTKDRKNALESYVYDTRNKISERYRSFATDSEREGLVNLQQTEEWHYQEGNDETQAVYSSKLEELKKLEHQRWLSVSPLKPQERYQFRIIKPYLEHQRWLSVSPLKPQERYQFRIIKPYTELKPPTPSSLKLRTHAVCPSRRAPGLLIKCLVSAVALYKAYKGN